MDLNGGAAVIDSLSDVISACIGALVAAVTLIMTFRREREKAAKEAKDRVRAFLGALKTELETVWEVYSQPEGLGPMIEALRPGQDLLGEWLLSQKYFHVYESNAGLVGEIPDPALRNQIVRTVTRAASLIDAINYHNGLRRDLPEQPPNATTQPVRQRYERMWGEASAYGAVLQGYHAALKADVVKLREMFTKHGIE